MILIEFPQQLQPGKTTILKYKMVEENDWYYLYIDIETLHILVSNFGIISTVLFPPFSYCIDHPSTGADIKVSYGGAEVQLCCTNCTNINIAHSYFQKALRSLAQPPA